MRRLDSFRQRFALVAAAWVVLVMPALVLSQGAAGAETSTASIAGAGADDPHQPQSQASGADGVDGGGRAAVQSID